MLFRHILSFNIGIRHFNFSQLQCRCLIKRAPAFFIYACDEPKSMPAAPGACPAATEEELPMTGSVKRGIMPEYVDIKLTNYRCNDTIHITIAVTI